MVHLDYQLKMTQDERWNMLRRNHESTELGTNGKQLRRIYGVTNTQGVD